MDYKLFVNQFFKNPKEIGTFTTSSKFLAAKMAKAIGNSINVVEFGSGTGAVTTEILKYLPQTGMLTCFEMNPAFCELLKKIGDPRIKIINDVAENAQKYVDCTDCIISSVPLTIMTKQQRQKILTLASGARRFIQLQYMPVLTKEMRQHFQRVSLEFVALNLPPAFVYICS